MKFRHRIMKEYSFDMSVYNKEFEDQTKVTPSLFKDNPYTSRTNIDNYPSHKEEGTGKEYAMATKNWRNVDPNVGDPQSLHYAAANKVYLMLKNRFTDAWEFPSGEMFFGDTFYKARHDLFKSFADKWSIQHIARAP